MIWTQKQRERIEAEVADLAERVSDLEVPSTHPLDRIEARVDTLGIRLARLEGQVTVFRWIAAIALGISIGLVLAPAKCAARGWLHGPERVPGLDWQLARLRMKIADLSSAALLNGNILWSLAEETERAPAGHSPADLFADLFSGIQQADVVFIVTRDTRQNFVLKGATNVLAKIQKSGKDRVLKGVSFFAPDEAIAASLCGALGDH